MAQLAMHSSYETAGSEDVETFIRAVAAFYGTVLQADSDSVNICN